MEQVRRDIQFVSTEDGVNIAYWELGSGLPVIISHNWSLSHAELEWEVPSIASFLTDLSAHYRVIRFDPRGHGLSDPMPADRGLTPSGALRGMSVEEACLDISAVAKATGIVRFALMVVQSQGPLGITYAAKHPDQVMALILCDATAKIPGSFLDSAVKAQAALFEIEADVGGGRWSTPFQRVFPVEEAEAAGAVDQANFTKKPDTFGAISAAILEWDASDLLASIEAPTLILTSRNPALDVTRESRELAAGIPNAQLRMLGGRFAPYYIDRNATLEAIDKLLGPESRTAADADQVGFRTVVFTDIVGSTEYVRSVGDEAGRAAIRDLEQQIDELAQDHGGRVVKNLGDGSLIAFGSNSSAIRFALEVQAQTSGGPLRLRVGMAAGEPIQEDGDIHGTVVAHASRIGDLGSAGEVIVSDSVRQLAAGKGFVFEPRDVVTLKGFEEPERVWSVAYA